MQILDKSNTTLSYNLYMYIRYLCICTIMPSLYFSYFAFYNIIFIIQFIYINIKKNYIKN